MSIIHQALGGLRRAFAGLILEAPARRAGIDRLIKTLEKSGQAIEQSAARTSARPSNFDTLAHIIGIERWGQRRMRVALGEPLALEEYDGYRPEEKNWLALREQFRTTRQETISLCKSLRMAGVDPSTRVPHNQFGEITLLGWLLYLTQHAKIESMKIN